jgi:hypothetical protein
MKAIILTVSKSSESSQIWHNNDKREDVVNDRV